MTTLDFQHPRVESASPKRWRLDANLIPLIATVAVCAGLYGAACWRYDNFATPNVFIAFFGDNAFRGIAAVGMTFVILSGGIDLSVGSMIGLVSIVIAVLTEQHHWPAGAVIPLVLIGGMIFGVMQGCLIHFFSMAPFFVTLAGMFLARGLGQLVSLESVPLSNPLFLKLSEWSLPLGTKYSVPLSAIIFIAVAVIGMFLSRRTRFGRNTYAIGGSESSALLMGLPVARTKIAIYGFSGFCSALAGIVFGLYTLSGNSSAGVGLELDVIAAVVLGGTLLSGGVGTVFGTVMGILIFGIIDTSITFEGTLSSWWTKIAVGALVLLFIVMQKVIARLAMVRR